MLKVNTYHSKNWQISHNVLLHGSTPYGDYVQLKEDYKKLDDDYKYASTGKGWYRSKKFKQLVFNTKFLKKMLNKFGVLTCVFCGHTNLVIYHWDDRNKNTDNMATTDHFNPKDNGGNAFDEKNLVVACYKCNTKKGKKLWSIRTLRYLNVYGKFKVLVRELTYIK